MRVNRLLLLFMACLLAPRLFAQTAPAGPATEAPPDPGTAIDFVSDTQQPMEVEKILLHPTHNTRATALIFSDILYRKPAALFMLGDVVALGYSNKKWRKVDRFLDSARKDSIRVFALLGNHDVMVRDRRGERNFSRRFPEHFRTGYVETVDSVAVVLLNSNFTKLSPPETAGQRRWYQRTMDSLDASAAVRAIVVTAHHPVFTNSNVVRPSAGLQSGYLPTFLATRKAVLFITGHAHAFEHFQYGEKNFFVIGGGGGLHQPLTIKENMPLDKALTYKPLFHYLQLRRSGNKLQVTSFSLKEDFSGFSTGYQFPLTLP